MDNQEIIDTIRGYGFFEVYEIPYKKESDNRKYGKSFDTYLNDKEYVYVRVNGGHFKCKRIVEEFGRILFIYNGEQISWKPEDIQSIEIAELM